MARFKKGNPGGPGRPKGSSYVEICKDAMESGGWKKVIQLLQTGGPKRDAGLMLEAAKLLAAYGYGKPRQVPDSALEQGPVVFTLALGDKEIKEPGRQEGS